MKNNRMTKFNVIATLIAVLALYGSAVNASTYLVTYGTILDITPVYGPLGSIQAVYVSMNNLDTTGVFVYVCRRPNLGPCVNAIPGHDYIFTANMRDFCSVPDKICGEGLIESLTFQQ